MKDEKYILRCLQIAKNGNAFTKPNPSVGAVIVLNDKIIGEGFTSPFGGSHAEINAIHSVDKNQELQEATLYVTLEPCSHYGKTPPCANAIVKYGFKKVVIGCLDPNPKVKGNGVRLLREAGIEVVIGILEKECREHHKAFLLQHEKHRPYVILKWAQTKNGFMAPAQQKERKPFWISNGYSKQLVHKWRGEEQAILVGANTVLKDNPKLNVRYWFGKNPVRIVIDRRLTLPKNSFVFDDSVSTIVIVNESISIEQGNFYNTIFEKIDFNKPIANQICSILYNHNIQSVIVEGGAKTLNAFLNENLWDEARINEGNVTIEDGIIAPDISGRLVVEDHIDSDTIRVYRND